MATFPTASLPPAAGDPARAARARTGRWLLWLTLAAAAVLAASALLGTGGDPRDARAAPLVLDTADLARVAGAPETAFRRANSPVDVRIAERTAQGLTLGRIQPPQARHLASFRRADTGEEVTTVALVYDDTALAAAVDDEAAPLLTSNFGFQSTPIDDLAGVTDARLWSSGGYRAISFRQDGVVTFVGTNRTDDPAYIRRLGEAARDRVAARLAGLSTPAP